MAFPSPHRLPLHLRRGLLRIYIAVSVPWIAFFGYRLLDALQHPYRHHTSGAFWSLLVVPVGGPISLLVIMWVLAGFRRPEQTAGEAKTSARTDARPSQPHSHPKGSSVDTLDERSPHDYAEAGKALGKIFFEPDVWHEMNNFRERDALAARELAFARVAIIRDAIRRLQPHSVAIQMSAGVDQYVARAFAKQERATTAMIAIQAYEQNVLPLTKMANVLIRRLSYSGVCATEIASLLEKATAEAEQLMSVSSAIQKLLLQGRACMESRERLS
jgi:hypothetical protein